LGWLGEQWHDSGRLDRDFVAERMRMLLENPVSPDWSFPVFLIGANPADREQDTCKPGRRLRPALVAANCRVRSAVAADWDGAGAPGGASPRPEPGAGSAGPGAAQRRRLIPIRLNSATQKPAQGDRLLRRHGLVVQDRRSPGAPRLGAACAVR
jgi:hypothetical protein